MALGERLPQAWKKIKELDNKKANLNQPIFGAGEDFATPLYIRRGSAESTRNNLSIGFALNNFNRYLGIDVNGNLRYGTNEDINGNGTYVLTDKNNAVHGDNGTRSTNKGTISPNDVIQSGFYRSNKDIEGAIGIGDATQYINLTNPSSTNYGFQIGVNGSENGLYYRNKIGGIYSEWRKVFSTGSVNLQKTANGYVKFPNGLIIQWGTTGTYNRYPTDSRFPLAFTSTPRVTIGGYYPTESTVKTHILSTTIINVGLTSFRHLMTFITGSSNPEPVGGGSCHWMAIGY